MLRIKTGFSERISREARGKRKSRIKALRVLPTGRGRRTRRAWNVLEAHRPGEFFSNPPWKE